MTRNLGQLDRQDKEVLVQTVHREAQEAKWHQLNHREKGRLYDEWSTRFDVKRTAFKDSIMKGFDAAQRRPPSGEAAVHQEVKALIIRSKVPWWNDMHSLWSGKASADFVLGFSERFITVVAELESIKHWQLGVQQAVWYRAAYFNESGLLALPCLILFGDATARRWHEVCTTCMTLGILVVTFDLRIDESAADYSLQELLGA